MKIAKLKLLPGIMLAVVALLAITVGPVMAQPPVTSPFSGDVTIDGAPAPNGSDVAAYVGAETAPRATTTITTVGQYGLALIGTAGDVGKSVSFKVKKAGTGVWLDATTAPPNPTFANYDPQVVDLFATSPALPTVAFSSATYSVGEGDGSTTITVNLSAASAETVTVDYATSDGTATAGADYTAASGTLTFSPGDTSETFSVGILEDALVEGDETVNLSLSGPTNATLGTPSTAVLTIVDNDAAPTEPTIAFSPASFSFWACEGGADPEDQILEIWNLGTGTLGWLVSDDAAWLSLSPTSGSSTGEHDSVTVSVGISGKDVGDYGATITISDPEAANTPQTVPVSLHIVEFDCGELTNVELMDVDPGVNSITVCSCALDEVDMTDMPAGVDCQCAYVVGATGTTGSFCLCFTDIADASSIRVYKVVDTTWTLLPVIVIDATTVRVTMEVGDPPIVFALPTAPPPPTGVGGTAYPPNKLAILAPWIALAAAIIAGATIFMRRRRARS